MRLSSGHSQQPVNGIKHSLLTTFRPGLDPRVRLYLTAYDDSIGLERFEACLKEHQGQSYSAFFCRTVFVSLSEPVPEPMQVEHTHLTFTKQQSWLTRGQCLYCGASGHAIQACPIRIPRPLVSVIKLSIVNMQPLTIEVIITASDISLPVHSLLDTGSTKNFISMTIFRNLHLPTMPTKTLYQVQFINGKPLSRQQVHLSAGPLIRPRLHRRHPYLLPEPGRTFPARCPDPCSPERVQPCPESRKVFIPSDLCAVPRVSHQ